jgi:PST family polysaccharide transporter
MAPVDSVPATNAPTEVPSSAQGLLPRVLQNSFWLFNSSAVVRLLNLARSIILARLLVPEDFGLFGLASSIIGFTLVFGDVGIGLSLLYRRDPEDDYKSTAFWMNATLASLLLGAVAIASPLLSSLYARRELIPILIVLATAFWCQIAAVVHRNLLRRELRFRALAAVEAAVSVVSFVVAAALAFWGGGVWAFVLSLLAGNTLSLILLWWVSGWSPAWRWSRAASKEIGVFSGWYLTATLVFYLAFSLDRLLIGKFLGLQYLGWYVLAADMSIALVSAFTAPLQNALLPELAALRENPPRFWDAYLSVSRAAACLVAPLIFAAILVAPVLLPAVFGAKWALSIDVFRIFAAYILLRSVIGDPFGAWGRYDLSFRLGLKLVAFSAVGIVLAMRWGIEGVAGTIAALSLTAVLVAVYQTGSRSALVGLIKNCLPPILLAAATAFLAWGAWRLAERILPPAPLVLALAAAALHLTAYVVFYNRQLLSYGTVFLKGRSAASRAR